MDYRRFLSLLLVISLAVISECSEELKVSVKQGEMIGSEMTSQNGAKFYGFRGIPYGKPPVGPLRFKLPEAADSWEGVLDASKDGPICPQVMGSQILGQEDCLYLYVYTSKLPSENDASVKLPVIVFFPGSGFYIGDGTSNDTGPHRLMDREIVFVTMNYRLNLFGFLSTEDSASPGNYGLWDQRLALQWVKENIHAFGGNPDQITIGGWSPGAASVTYHLISPASKGLFHGAFIMSGTALCRRNFQQNPLKVAQRLAQDAQCPITSSQELVDCLRQKTTEELLTLLQASHYNTWVWSGLAASEQIPMNKEKNFAMRFLPSVASSDGPNFFDDLPATLFRYGQINRVPVVIGIGDSEGLEIALANMEKMKSLDNEGFNTYLTKVLAVAGGVDEKDVPAALSLYNNLTDINDPEFQSTFTEAVSDAMFGAGYQQLLLYLVKNNVPVYTYKVEHSMKYTYVNLVLKINATGVSHSDDLSLLLNEKQDTIVEGMPEKLEGADKEMSEKYKDLWVNFATYGDPTPDNGIDVGVKWNPVTSEDKIDYLRIRLPLEMASTQPSQKLKFWYEKETKSGAKERVCDEL